METDLTSSEIKFKLKGDYRDMGEFFFLLLDMCSI